MWNDVGNMFNVYFVYFDMGLILVVIGLSNFMVGFGE